MAKNGQAKMKSGSGGFGIKGKMLLGILPFVIASLVIMAVVIIINSRSIIHSQTQAEMNAQLAAQANSVKAQLDTVSMNAEDLAVGVGANYKTMTVEQIEQMCSAIVKNNELASGSGVWFEPYAFDEKEEYYGPYWYADGDKIVEDWEYSNADYNYFEQEYYTDAKGMSEPGASITDPYYDEASGTVMASCSAPIFNNDNKYIGCITVDLTLDTVSAALDAVELSNAARIIMADSKGTYIYNPNDPEAAANSVTLDSDSALSPVASEIMGKESGSVTYKGGGSKYNLYFTTIPGINWKLAISVPLSEINKPINRMMTICVFISIIAIIICTITIFLQASSIAKSMQVVRAFAEELAKGNFTVDEINVRRKDEIGDMAHSLNAMYENNSSVIRNISAGSTKVNSSSNQLDDVAVNLSSQFENIQDSMVRVNDAMTNTGAATEQVSASANEVNASVQRLADETAKTGETVREIKARAEKIQAHSKESSDNAIAIAEKRGRELEEASAKAEVVQEIGTLADSIADIASQINLLSLNASIEAARAGEHGRGFAVVATEINSLAMETKEAVDRIQETINAIQEAFESLDESSGQLLKFVQETVTPDYDNFIEVGKQYGDDAESFGELSEQIAEMVEYIKESMDQVNAAVSSIAESATETAESSSEVTETVNEVSGMVTDVSGMAQEQKSVSNNLSDIVSQFTLND